MSNSRRSPLKEPPLPQAGESLLHEFYVVLVSKCMVWVLVAALSLVSMIAEWERFLSRRPPVPTYVTAIMLPVLVVAAVKVFRGIKKAKQLRLGMEGEQAVGQTLERMRAYGYEVFHDIPAEDFNVDHVLIGPAGVFVIETKTVSKPIRGDFHVRYDGERVLVNGHTPDRNPLAQARAVADHVRKLLANTLERQIAVRPVVLYPGWFVEKQPRGVEVWVLNPKALAAFMVHEDIVLSPREVARLADELARRIRSVIM